MSETATNPAWTAALNEATHYDASRRMAGIMRLTMGLGKHGVEVSSKAAGSWIDGSAVPDAATHALLLEILAKREDADPLALATMKECYIAPPTLPPAPEATTRSNPAKPKKHDGIYKRDRKILDARGLPARLYQGNMPYETLSKQELVRIRDTTENAPELMQCLRLAYGFTRAEIEELALGESGTIAFDLDSIEHGATLPSKKLLAVLEPVIKRMSEGTRIFDRLVEGTIRNRLLLIEQATKTPSTSTIGKQLEVLPACYWRAVLDQCNDPAAWAARKDKPVWADAMLPIETQGDYLLAARHLLGKTSAEFASAMQSHKTMVLEAEQGTYPSDPQNLIARMVDCHEALQTRMMDAAAVAKKGSHEADSRPFFDRAVLARLPTRSHNRHASHFGMDMETSASAKAR